MRLAGSEETEARHGFEVSLEAVRGFGFDKVEGLGNDFVVVQAESEGGFDAGLVASVCDRRFGVGADGVLLVLPARDGGSARMKVLNADGSVPEMCGNGVRCVALVLAAREALTRGELVVETDSGPRVCAFERDGRTADVDVDMGVVRVTGERTLVVDGESLPFTLADAGNPHAIAYRDDPTRDLPRFGLPVATHASFARGTNVELVRWRGGALEVAVWERGVGPTLACGTGACAVAAVACARGEAVSGAPVTTRLPGGDLVIRHDTATGRTRMRGPARIAFRGEWPA